MRNVLLLLLAIAGPLLKGEDVPPSVQMADGICDHGLSPPPRNHHWDWYRLGDMVAQSHWRRKDGPTHLKMWPHSIAAAHLRQRAVGVVGPSLKVLARLVQRYNATIRPLQEVWVVHLRVSEVVEPEQQRTNVYLAPHQKNLTQLLEVPLPLWPGTH